MDLALRLLWSNPWFCLIERQAARLHHRVGTMHWWWQDLIQTRRDVCIQYRVRRAHTRTSTCRPSSHWRRSPAIGLTFLVAYTYACIDPQSAPEINQYQPLKICYSLLNGLWCLIRNRITWKLSYRQLFWKGHSQSLCRDGIPHVCACALFHSEFGARSLRSGSRSTACYKLSGSRRDCHHSAHIAHNRISPGALGGFVVDKLRSWR
jgi:hypothetical protein